MITVYMERCTSFIFISFHLTQNIIRETIKVEEKKWIKIEFWHIPDFLAHLEHDLYF